MASKDFSIRNNPASVPPIEITIVLFSNENFSLNSSLEKFVCLTIGPTLLCYLDSLRFQELLLYVTFFNNFLH